MPINFEKFYKNISNLYNDIKRLQVNIDDSLAVTLSYIYNCCTVKTLYVSNEDKGQYAEELKKTPGWYKDSFHNEVGCDFITNNTAEFLANKYIEVKQYISNVPRSIIKRSIEKLIEQNSQFLQPSSQKTSTSTEKIISAIAKRLPVKTYMDIAIGTGSLLANLDGEIYGSDINPRMAIIAKVYLYFCDKNIHLGEHDKDYDNIQTDDSLENYIQYNKKEPAVIIFDPPMGDLRQIPDKWIQNEKLAEIIKSKKKNLKLPSEVLFLLNFLIKSNKNDYFIGLFPESIRNRNNNEYNNLRQYILRNSLLAVIKVQTGHVLLVGINSTNLRTKYQRIPILNIKGHLNSEQIEYIANHITKKNYEYEEFYDIEPIDRGTIIQQIGLRKYNKMHAQIFAYKVYARDELLVTNSIPIPTISSYEEKISKNPKELLKSIQEKENNIKNAITYIENIISELPEDEEVPEEKQWFEDGTTEEEKALKYFWDIRTEKYFESEPFISQYKYKNKMDKECLSNLKILKKCKRLTFTKASYINIHFGEKDNKNKLKDEVFYTKLKPINFDKNIKLLLNMADETVKNIYDNHCRYTIGDLPEEETYLNNKEYGFKDLVRAFDVLEKLGLVIRNYIDETESKSEMSLYNEYSTYIPTIDKEGEKRYVY